MELTLQEIRGLKLIGTGTAFPQAADGVPGVVDNQAVYEHLFGARWQAALDERSFSADKPEDEWGVASRAWCRWPGEAGGRVGASELATRAARAALEQAAVDPSEIDLLVVAGSTPARISRSTSSLVAAELGLAAACFDVKSGGAGGLSAWVTAASLLAAGARRALVVASETPSSYLATSDLVGCLLYGDGAAALLLEREPDYAGGLLAGAMGSCKAEGVPFTIPGRLPPTSAALEAGEYFFQREDATYRKQLAQSWRQVSRTLKECEEMPDWFLPYGVHAAQVRNAAEELGISLERCRTTLGTHGCIGCAGPLAALHELRASENPRAGIRIATSAVAGGIHWAGFHWEL